MAGDASESTTPSPNDDIGFLYWIAHEAFDQLLKADYQAATDFSKYVFESLAKVAKAKMDRQLG